jgi:hypothetical protein
MVACHSDPVGVVAEPTSQLQRSCLLSLTHSLALSLFDSPSIIYTDDLTQSIKIHKNNLATA